MLLTSSLAVGLVHPMSQQGSWSCTLLARFTVSEARSPFISLVSSPTLGSNLGSCEGDVCSYPERTLPSMHISNQASAKSTTRVAI